MKNAFLILVPLFLASCSKFGFMGVENVERAASEVQAGRTLAQKLIPIKMEIVSDSATLSAQNCEGFTANTRAENGYLSGVNSDMQFSLATDSLGKFYEDPSCTKEASKHTIARGYSSQKFYFKSAPLKNALTESIRVVASTTYFPNGGAPFTFSLTLGVVNTNPTTQDLEFSIDEDTTLSVKLLAIDENGDRVTFVKDTDPLYESSVSLTAEGLLSYTPRQNFNGTDSFLFHAYDGRTNSETKRITIKVKPINDPPIFNGGSFTVSEEQARSINLAALVSDNDLDPLTNKDYQEILSYEIATPSANGMFLLSGAILTYTPRTDYNGTDSIRIKVTDKAYASSTGEITLSVQPVNDPPVAMNLTLTTNEDTSGSEVLKGTDKDSTLLTYIIVANPTKGTITAFNPATGAFTYTPNSNAVGADSITFRARDVGGAESSNAFVYIAILAVNDAPVAANTAYTGSEDTPINGRFMAADVDGDSLTYRVTKSPEHGTFLGQIGTPNFTYTPALDYVGTDYIEFVAKDAALESAVGRVTFTIGQANDLPVALNGTLSVNEDNEVTGVFTGSDAETLPTALTFVISNGGLSGTTTLADDGRTFKYVPNKDFVGIDRISFQARDASSQLSANMGVITVTVNPVNDLPTVINSTTEVLMNSQGNRLIIQASDPDNTLTYSINPPSFGTATNTSNFVTYTPPPNFTGTATIFFTVREATTPFSSVTGTLTVLVGDGTVASVTNGPLCLAGEDGAVLTQEHLNAKVSGRPGLEAFIYFTITRAPVDGDLFRNDVELGLGSTFSQADINAGRIRYFQPGVGNDFFTYTIDYLGDSQDPIGPLQFEVRRGNGTLCR